MDRKELAVHLHENNFNCAQSVACAFANVFGYDPVNAFRGIEAFGLGMGCQTTCGAVSGMAYVIGMARSDGNLDEPATKHECYALMELAFQAFVEKNGSAICSDLRDPEDEQAHEKCNSYIQDGVAIIDKILLGLDD